MENKSEFIEGAETNLYNFSINSGEELRRAENLLREVGNPRAVNDLIVYWGSRKDVYARDFLKVLKAFHEALDKELLVGLSLQEEYEGTHGFLVGPMESHDGSADIVFSCVDGENLNNASKRDSRLNLGEGEIMGKGDMVIAKEGGKIKVNFICKNFSPEWLSADNNQGILKKELANRIGADPETLILTFER